MTFHKHLAIHQIPVMYWFLSSGFLWKIMKEISILSDLNASEWFLAIKNEGTRCLRNICHTCWGTWYLFRVKPLLKMLESKYQSINTIPGWLMVSLSFITRDIHLRWQEFIHSIINKSSFVLSHLSNHENIFFSDLWVACGRTCDRERTPNLVCARGGEPATVTQIHVLLWLLYPPRIPMLDLQMSYTWDLGYRSGKEVLMLWEPAWLWGSKI